jgi:hypothetical protein
MTSSEEILMRKRANTPYHPKPVQVWEWILVYPAYWLILLIGPLVDRLPMRERRYSKGTYRGGI